MKGSKVWLRSETKLPVQCLYSISPGLFHSHLTSACSLASIAVNGFLKLKAKIIESKPTTPPVSSGSSSSSFPPDSV